MDRKSFIGGSDIAAVMGMSRWTTPLQLWSEKTGKVAPPDLSENEAVEMGTELEDTVARLFTKRTGKKVRKAPKYYEHPEYPYMKCQVDRLVEGTDELLECKTASAWKLKEWEEDEIPAEYILQVQWQMGITGRTKGWIAVLIGGQKFMYKELVFDQSLWLQMMSNAEKFWEMVQKKQEPMAVGNDNSFITELHPKEHSDHMQEIQEMNNAVATLQTLKSTIKDTIEEKDRIEAQLKQVIGDNLGLMTDEYKVIFKQQTTKRLDSKSLKISEPDVYAAFLKESQSRVLRVRKV